MANRASTILVLMLSLTCGYVQYLTISWQNHDHAEHESPAAPVEEKAENAEQSKFEKSRLTDFSLPVQAELAILCEWHQIVLATRLLPESSCLTTHIARGPPAI